MIDERMQFAIRLKEGKIMASPGREALAKGLSANDGGGSAVGVASMLSKMLWEQLRLRVSMKS